MQTYGPTECTVTVVHFHAHLWSHMLPHPGGQTQTIHMVMRLLSLTEHSLYASPS